MKAGANASCRHAHCEASQLDSLFAFLGENVTGTLRATARENLMLADWAEEKHTRRMLPSASAERDGGVQVAELRVDNELAEAIVEVNTTVNMPRIPFRICPLQAH